MKQILVQLSFILTVVILVACSPRPSIKIESGATTNAFEAIASYSSESFLFMAVELHETCSESCDCIVLEQIRTPYIFENGTLYLVKWFLENEPSTWIEYRKANEMIGMYSFWEASDAMLTKFNSLPYHFERTVFEAQAVDRKGSLLLTIDFSDVVIEREKKVIYEWTEFGSNDCQILHTYEITNLGFIDDTQVVIIE